MPNSEHRVRGTAPLAALFILFDLVVHNPAHPETELNLSLLDMAAGYFSRFDYATNGAVPAALLSGFAHIANQFVKETREHGANPNYQPTAYAGSAPISPNSLDDGKTQQAGALELGVPGTCHWLMDRESDLTSTRPRSFHLDGVQPGRMFRCAALLSNNVDGKRRSDTGRRTAHWLRFYEHVRLCDTRDSHQRDLAGLSSQLACMVVYQLV